MILSCNDISKAFGTDEILKNISFHIEDHEKAAIVGINGAGKSTLMKILVGEISPDSGQVIISHGATVGYLAQHQDPDTDKTVFDEMLGIKADILNIENMMRSLEIEMKNAKGAILDEMLERYAKLTHSFEQMNGYAYRSEITGVLKGLGFTEEDFDKPVNTLSGGQKTRVALGRLLLVKPDIILLDEPTNHLDLESVKWLETFLLNYSGSVIIVAHDRYFLDRIVTKIIELDNGFGTVYLGNYTQYSEKRAILRNMKLKEYLNRQREIKHQEEVITKLRQFNREKSIKRAESREKMLERMTPVERPVDVNDKMRIVLEPNTISGNDVLTVTNLTKSFDGNKLFANANFEIKRGEHVALIGNNGTGKTTILKIINGIVSADSGGFQTGSKVSVGYYDQEQHVLDPDKTLFDEIATAYPDLNNTKIRNTLAAFLFTNDDVFKYIRDLSGGEKARVSLAKLMLSDANFLILDEPTNHLDMVSKEILENAINSYTGTVFYVSHDRYFINTTATRILELTHNTLLNYIGNYDYYEEKREAVTAQYLLSLNTSGEAHTAAGANAQRSFGSEDTAVSSPPSNSKSEWQVAKQDQSARRRREREIARLESAIEKHETRISQIDEESALPENCSDTAKLLELHNEREKLSSELDTFYEQWGKLSDNE